MTKIVSQREDESPLATNAFVLSGGTGAAIWAPLYLSGIADLEHWFGESTVLLYATCGMLGLAPILASALMLRFTNRKVAVYCGITGWVLTFGYFAYYGVTHFW